MGNFGYEIMKISHDIKIYGINKIYNDMILTNSRIIDYLNVTNVNDLQYKIDAYVQT